MIFISYSRKDESLVLPLIKFLRASGQRVFVDQQDLEYGGDWKNQIAQTIGESDRFLLFWSKSSKSSPYVAEEWRVAIATERCGIVPILLDRTPLPSQLQRFHGTTELAALFRTLKHMRVMRRVLWVSWLMFSVVLAIALPVVLVMGPIEELAHILLNLIPWLVILAIPVFFLRQILINRTQTVYHDVMGKLTGEG